MFVQAAWDSSAVVRALINGRPMLKQQAISAIDAKDPSIDREQLRVLLMSAIRRDFRAPRPGIKEEPKFADTRCWLLSALARVAEEDSEAANETRKHLEMSYEPHYWARFWTLEGLISAQPLDLRQLADTIMNSPSEVPVVINLARVVVAAMGNEDALDEIRQTLKEGEWDNKWAVLRSLRVVPKLVPYVVRELAAIVEAGEYDDITFDAIVALGRLSPENQYADTAAQCLANFLIRHRWPMYESMRAKALIGLGQLCVERTAPVLIEELFDDSPAIVQEAARTLERVVGIRTAIARLLEVSQRLGPEAVTKFANALRWMDRTAVVEGLEAVILTTSDAQQQFARELLSEVGGQYAFQKLRARTDAATKYAGALEQAEEKIRTLFETSIHEAQSGFRTATRMDITVFVLGIVLIGVSAGLLLMGNQTLDTWAGVGITGGAGVLSILYTLFVARPRDQVRDAVDHLMYLKVVFLGYLRQLHQSDQAFTRRLLDEERLPAAEVREFAEMVGTTMGGAIAQLSNRAAPAREVVERYVTSAQPAQQLSASGVQVYDSRAPAV
jgi:hypothetical protein